MEKAQHSHDIQNLLERLKIIHDLARDEKFDTVSKEEMREDLKEAIKRLETIFTEFLQ